MGDPKQIRRKYYTPKHPWQEERIEREKIILENYSLKNKKEIWKMQSVLKKFTEQAKRLSNLDSEQAKKEKEQLINKLFRLGLVKKNAGVDDVLSLTLENILDRRLQTMVYKLNMANTIKQARQFIVHGHVFINDNKINVPSYLVNIDEENKIKFKENSNLTGKFGKAEEEKKKETKKESKEEEKKEEKKEEKPKTRKARKKDDKGK